MMNIAQRHINNTLNIKVVENHQGCHPRDDNMHVKTKTHTPSQKNKTQHTSGQEAALVQHVASSQRYDFAPTKE
jgi:hypothetical protein